MQSAEFALVDPETRQVEVDPQETQLTELVTGGRDPREEEKVPELLVITTTEADVALEPVASHEVADR